MTLGEHAAQAILATAYTITKCVAVVIYWALDR